MILEPSSGLIPLEEWRRGWDSNPRSPFGDTRSPGVPVRPLQHLSARVNLPLAERVGFEPTLRKPETAFRERHHQPLGHLSKASRFYPEISLGGNPLRLCARVRLRKFPWCCAPDGITRWHLLWDREHPAQKASLVPRVLLVPDASSLCGASGPVLEYATESLRSKCRIQSSSIGLALR
jgi:hypothetical protein